MALGNLDKAGTELTAALQRLPAHRPALEAQARLRAAQGDTRGALEIIDGLLAKDGGDAPALALRADILLHGGLADGRQAAVELYRKALEGDPKLLPAHTGLIAIHLADRNLDELKKQWHLLNVALPGHPATRFFEAVLALLGGEPQRAREIAQQLARWAPDNPRVQMLSGQAELASGALLQAEAHFNKAVLLAPSAPEPRRALVQAYLQMGQPKRALDQVAPLTGPRSRDAEALLLAGRAYLMTGDTAAAEASFARAAELNPSQAGLRTGMALAQLGKGQTDAGLAALEAAARRDASTDGDLALINARLQRKQFQAALTAIDALERKTPGLPLPDLLRGRVAQMQGQAAPARKAFEAALAKSPQYLPALSALAELDIAEGKPEVSRARMAAAAKREAGNAALLVALADLTGRTGGTKTEVVTLLRDAVRAAPAYPEPRLRIIDYALTVSDFGMALTEAQAASAVLPEHPEVLDRLGLAQQRSGDLQQALTTFGKLASLQPRSAAPQLRLTALNLTLGRNDAAVTQARRALELEPDNWRTHQAAAHAASRSGRQAEALALARAAQKRWPAPGLQLEADLELAAGSTDGALAALRRANAAAPGRSDLAASLHKGLLAAGKATEAQAHAQGWLAKHPNDAAFLLYLGRVALGQDNFAQAEARFQQVLKLSPNNIEALNNLAHTLATQKKPGGVQLAERASKLAPNQPALMDTLALAKAAEGELRPALELQKIVVDVSPDEPAYRLTLARLQLQAGEKDRARENLALLAKRGAAFPQHAVVAQLLEQLRK
jgi:putative PEP-CTERM system TPR-repeat lipoprotein